MSIQTNANGIINFLQENDKLIKDITQTAKDAAAALATLADRLAQNRRDTQELVDRVGTIEFEVARSTDAKVKQQELLDEIADISKKIQNFRDQPEITTPLYATRSALYVALANTFNDTVRTIVTFTLEEIDEMKVLLRRATLDAEARQQWAHVLDGAVQLAKLGLKLALKLAAV